MIRRVAKFVGLPRGERALTAKILTVALFVEGGLRLRRFPVLIRLLGLSVERRPDGGVPPSPLDLASLVAAVDRVLRSWPTEGRCLRRSLVLGVLLRRHHPVIRFGVAKQAGRIDAHAWVELGAMPIGEPVDPTLRFVPLNVP